MELRLVFCRQKCESGAGGVFAAWGVFLQLKEAVFSNFFAEFSMDSYVQASVFVLPPFPLQKAVFYAGSLQH